MQNIQEVAKAMVTHGKGILAADESNGTMGKRLASVGAENALENRSSYRRAILTADGLQQYISGVILFDETFRSEGMDFNVPDSLTERGIIPGIKVDKGAKPFNAKFPEIEKITEGLDGLRERLEEYRSMGARFAKWRAVITPMPNTFPTSACMHANAHALARYAQLCQECDLVPIVEPEIILDNAISPGRCADVTKQTLWRTFDELVRLHVDLRGMILKTNMVMSGYSFEVPISVNEVAERTIKVLEETVPVAVPGIAFLSGGQTDEKATAHLNAMNELGDVPWALTFSYGRALQGPALRAWANGEDTQAALMERAMLNSQASVCKAARLGYYGGGW